VEDDLFFFGFGICNDTGAPDLGPGSSGGGDRDDGGDGIGIRPCPPIADIFEIPKRARLARQKGHQLAQIKARTAAKSDHPVVTTLFEGIYTCRGVFFIRVGINIRKYCASKPRRIEQIERSCSDLHLCQAAIRN